MTQTPDTSADAGRIEKHLRSLTNFPSTTIRQAADTIRTLADDNARLRAELAEANEIIKWLTNGTDEEPASKEPLTIKGYDQ